MKKKSLFKILVAFILAVSVVSSFVITSSAASFIVETDVWYRFVDSPYAESAFTISGVDFVVDGQEYDTIEFSPSNLDGNYIIGYITVSKAYTETTGIYLDIYVDGAWVKDDYRFIKFLDFGDVSPVSNEFLVLSGMLIDTEATPYGGLYGNVYSLIQDKIYGGYPLTGGAEIACSSVSTFLTIFVLVLPLAIVWLIIKSLTSLIGRVY